MCGCVDVCCLCLCAPLWLEIAECTVAPVAMEDSDHEVHSSSDEHDSCPGSLNPDEDQVLENKVISPLPIKY